ncbi:MAG: radical SAM protein [Candidatus Aenigmarchaeota archaeon]|nr:radical SAM protein [Candidatus Aenigmarchaeota archaeon]
MDLYRARIERLSKWAKKKKAPPVTIELVPTDRCNLNCLSCWRRGWDKKKLEERYKQEMSDERLLELVDEAVELGVLEIAFVGGGEPLARKVTLKMFKKMKEYNMIGDLVTNGTLFTKKSIEMMVKIGWDRIKFSIDGPDAKIHDYVRQTKGAFKATVNNIKYFAKMKKKYKTDKPRLILQSVLSKENYKKFPELVKLAHRIGVDEMTLLPLTVFDESMRHLKLTKKEVKEFIPILRKCIDMANKFGIETNYHEFLDEKYILKTEDMNSVLEEELDNFIKKEYPRSRSYKKNFLFLPCYAPWIHMTILPNGNIAPCFSPWVWETNVSVKNHSLKELWYGDYFNKFRKIIFNRKLPDNCKKCCVWEVFNNRKVREGLVEVLG